ncbi:MAG: hypothetical protein U1E76_16395 [Planctomycetota bacterium]
MSWSPSVSADGRHVVFNSIADDLVPFDHPDTWDIFVHDRDVDGNGVFDEPGRTRIVRIAPATPYTGTPDISSHAFISGNGRWVTFSATDPSLIVGDTNGVMDVLVHDRDADGNGVFDEPGGTALVRVSVSSTGAEANGDSGDYSRWISADGRFVAFDSHASNLVAGDTNGLPDLFVHDRDLDQDGIFDEPDAIATVRVSISATGEQGNNGSGWDPSMSDDGRYVAFSSWASNLLPNGQDSNGRIDLFVFDRDADRDRVFDEPDAINIVRVSVGSGGEQGNDSTDGGHMSADGRFVAFWTRATNFDPQGDVNGGAGDVFVHDRDFDGDGIYDEQSQPGGVRTVLVSKSTAGEQGNGDSADPKLSADARFVVFSSAASNLVGGDSEGFTDCFLHDRDVDQDGIYDEPDAVETVRVSTAVNGGGGNADSRHRTGISANGKHVVFDSYASDLVAADDNGQMDVFLRAFGCASASWSVYGAGWPGSLGIPDLAMSDPPVLCATPAMHIGNSRGNPVQAVLFLGFASADLPTAWQGTLLVLPSITIPLGLPSNGVDLPVSIPCDEALCGAAIYLQVLEHDLGASRGVAFTPGLVIVLGDG